MRELHAQCVKFSRIINPKEKLSLPIFSSLLTAAAGDAADTSTGLFLFKPHFSLVPAGIDAQACVEQRGQQMNRLAHLFARTNDACPK